MGKGKKTVGADNQETSGLSKKQSGTETKNKEEELVVMDEITKKALILKGQSDVRKRSNALAEIFGKTVEMVQVGQIDSVEELKQLIAENPEVVMIEAEILPNLLLAEILLTTDIYESIQIRQSMIIDSGSDDKITIYREFRKYLEPLTRVRFE